MKRLFVCIALLWLTGCQHTQIAEDIGQWDLQNYEASKTLAESFLVTWPLNSGFIRGALGEKINELPMSAVRALDELDLIAQMPKPVDDFNLGRSLGLRVRMLGALVRQALEMFAPEVLQYVRFF